MDLREVEKALEDLEPKVERLKALYQQYFMGIEKIPPNVLRKDVERTIWRLRRARFRQTRLQFKFQQLVQRFNTYQNYWARILREIEKGTYKRDVLRAARRIGAAEAKAVAGRAADAALRSQGMEDDGPPTSTPVWSLNGEDLQRVEDEPRSFSPTEAQAAADVGAMVDELTDVDGQVGVRGPSAPPSAPAAASTANNFDADIPVSMGELVDALIAGEPAAPPPPPPAPRRPPPRRPPPPRPGTAPRNTVPSPPARRPPPKRDQTRQLYDEYVRAKRKRGDHGDVSYEKLAKSLERQAERLKAKHGDRKVDFRVVEKEGRVMIRPVLRRGDS
ncbi:MAG: MXAN_5187 C-terminal domain-containing protein [Myxococcota bacterium]